MKIIKSGNVSGESHGVMCHKNEAKIGKRKDYPSSEAISVPSHLVVEIK